MKKIFLPILTLLTLISCDDETSKKSTDTVTSAEQKAPIVQDGNKIDRPAYSLTYPDNWKIDSSDADFNYDSFFSIDGDNESFISVFILNNSLDPAEAV